MVCEERIPPEKIVSTVDMDDTEELNFEDLSVGTVNIELLVW